MELHDLIAQVEGDDALDRLSNAMSVKADLDVLGDDLIGHFVDQARKDGRSWSEIGSAMGVSKQAAQQRHTSERRPPRERPPWRMGGRWTERAKNAVREANSAASELGSSRVDTEHLLLGMLAIPQGLAGRVLLGAGVRRDEVLGRMRPADADASGRRRHIPLAPAAKTAISQSYMNAVRLGHNYVGTEHLLLGLFDVPDSVAAQVLLDKGLAKDAVEQQIVEIIRKVS